MEKIILKGHKGVGGVAEGEAIVTSNPISYMSDVGGVWDTPINATVTNKRSLPDLYGKDLGDKILVFSTGKGGIFSTALIMSLQKKGLAPRAMVNIKSHPVFVLIGITCNIPIVDNLDQNPCEVIETGDWVKVDAENGVVEVTKKKK